MNNGHYPFLLKISSKYKKEIHKMKDKFRGNVKKIIAKNQGKNLP